MAANKLLKVRLSLKGRPIRAYVFDQDCVRVGRNPDADVYLDNPGISRDHLVIERTAGGYVAQDLNSANGTFVNDRPIQKQYLVHEDVIRIGKFSLWVSLEEDRRAGMAERKLVTAGTMGGTTVLRTGELEEMMRTARESEPAPPPEPQPQPVAVAASGLSRRGQLFLTVGLLVTFGLGLTVGIGAMWYAIR